MEYEKMQASKKRSGSWKRVFKKGASVEQLNGVSTTTTTTTRRPNNSSSYRKRNDDVVPTKPQGTTKIRVEQNNVVPKSSGPVDGDTLQPYKEEPSKKQESRESSSHHRRRGGDGKSKTRLALSREFGRTSLPTRLSRNWVVEVSPAEWDAEENQWKYRILVQRRDLSKTGGNTMETATSFTNAFTWRSLADFCWLENALRAEYHGALMLPLLSIAIGTADLANTLHEVDAGLLRDWLGDVFNGIRGQGEIVLDMNVVNIISSEAMEAFLYRNTDPLPTIDPRGETLGHKNRSKLPSTSSLDLPWKDSGDRTSWKDSNEEDSFVNSLFTKPFDWLPLDSVCGDGTTGDEDEKRNSKPVTSHIPLEMVSCSSRAVGDSATLDMKDSFAEPLGQHQQQNSSKLAIHSELLEAEKELVASYRSSALSTMEKLRVLSEEEAQIGAAWKRFAIALSNLFAFEKEIENTRIGGKEKKEHLPYRRLRKRDVEDCLRVMARQKMDRSTPSLRVLGVMLGAYVADLSAVEPAVDAYSQAVVHLAGLDEAVASATRIKNNRSEDSRVDCGDQWHEQLKALASLKFGEVKKQFTGNSGTSLRTATTDASSTDAENVAAQQKRAFEQRVLSNERMLRQFVTTLCKATPIRVARMAWKYFKMESGQTALLKGASISMRTKVNVASSKTLAELAKRHERENLQDNKTELELVQRIVEVSSSKRYSSNPQQSSVSGSESEASSEFDDDDQEDEEEKALLRAQALQVARERTGLWDAKLALSIMEAVGINDAEVRVEETTRDLRLVRKHAIGLRENLGRCVEAVDILSAVILQGDQRAHAGAMSLDEESYVGRRRKNNQRGSRIRETRQGFMNEISSVFSGASIRNNSGRKISKSAFPSARVLAGAGIDTTDPAGWIVGRGYERGDLEEAASRGRRRCGEKALSYTTRMDKDVDLLLQRTTELLKAYQTRVEGIESFVYMHCVGIQLEKHFSQKRSQALTAWEKKTDITTAINIATRKNLPLLVNELQAKLDNITPRNVSHTTVKETKEMHLASKTLKTELQDLANRRFLRARETASHRVVELMTLWAKYEEAATSEELHALGEAVGEIELSVHHDSVPDYVLHSSR